ncbi:MAG: RHS repeat-associated core domain-containing protein [Patescibacteria group bacterium]|nr:RHS repeat-associated core domain-containing protein [Patescibacteria group bacterium]
MSVDRTGEPARRVNRTSSACGGSDQDVTVETTYTPDGQIATYTAVNPATGDQVTRYVYGTTLADSGVARSDLLRAVIYPDSDDTGATGVPPVLGDGIDGVYDRVEYKYNRLGHVIWTKDQNETVHEYAFDGVGRQTADRVTLPQGSEIDDSVLRIEHGYEVRGMVASITSFDATTGGNAVNQILREYDDWGLLTKEYQEHAGEVDANTLYVQYNYADASAGLRLESVRYPNGRLVHYTYGSAGSDADHLNRLDAIRDDDGGNPGDVLAQYTYLGLGTVVVEDYVQPQVKLDLWGGTSGTYQGFDRFGRIVDHLWRDYGASADADRFLYGYDRAGNRIWKENDVSANLGTPLHLDELHEYDELYRLINTQRGNLSANHDAITDKAFEQDWGLDATGNWEGFNQDDDGDGTNDLEQTREHNEANEVTSASDWASPAHDRVGNMTGMPKPASPADALDAKYDAWNRLVEVSEGGILIARFSYDGAGRRILKQLADALEPDQYIHFFHSGTQVVETREGDDSAGVPDPTQLPPCHQFVWSPRYVDSLILRDEYAQGQLGDGERVFYLADANFNVTALVGLVETEPDVFEWQVVERYVYSPYGAVTIYAPDWSTVLAESAFDNTTLYTGREFDSETGLYYYRARYYHAELGQFISRDPIGYDAGDVNLYRYVRNGVLNSVDPDGTDRWVVHAYGHYFLAVEVWKDGQVVGYERLDYNACGFSVRWHPGQYDDLKPGAPFSGETVIERAESNADQDAELLEMWEKTRDAKACHPLEPKPYLLLYACGVNCLTVSLWWRYYGGEYGMAEPACDYPPKSFPPGWDTSEHACANCHDPEVRAWMNATPLERKNWERFYK